MSEPSSWGELRFEVEHAAAPAVVWDAVTAGIGEWWPEEFYCGAGKGPPVLHLEPRPGGRMWEDWGEGDGLLWATVLVVQREEQLVLQGHLAPDWGGPNLWIASLTFTPQGEGTLLSWREGVMGRVGGAHLDEKRQGWEFVFGRCLGAHLEGGPAPKWS